MIKLIFDCLRSPYDWASVLQVALAVKSCEIHVTGNSLHHDHPKIFGKVKSWSSKIKKENRVEVPIYYYPSLEECVTKFKSEGIKIIGTSPHAGKSFYDLDLGGDSYAIVFGTESSGLSESKASLMDDLVKIPMSEEVDFMTLSVIVPIVVYEIVRQKNIQL